MLTPPSFPPSLLRSLQAVLLTMLAYLQSKLDFLLPRINKNNRLLLKNSTLNTVQQDRLRQLKNKVGRGKK
jgi:hypothetical protein